MLDLSAFRVSGVNNPARQYSVTHWNELIDALESINDAVGEVDARGFASLAEADTYAAAIKATLIIKDIWAVSANITLQSHLRFVQEGALQPAAGVNIHLQGGYDAGIWRSCFDLTLGGSVTGEQVGLNTFVSVCHFGAGAAVSATDNQKAFQAALDYATLNPIRDEYASSFEVLIPPVPGNYTIGGNLTVRRNIIIRGGTPHGRSSSVSKLIFTAAATCGFWFQAPGGLSAPSPYDTELGANAWGSGRSRMSDLHIDCENPGAVDFGIVHNNPADFERISIQNMRLAAFFAHGQSSGNSSFGDPNGVLGDGTMYGNTNGSLYVRCLARDTTEGHGFVAQGNNTQIMTYLNCDASGNKGCGFRDNSSIGNYYLGCHTAQNSIKVEHNGVWYLPIKPHVAAADNEPGVGANWKEFWVVITATTTDVTWALGLSFRDAGGFNVANTGGNYPSIVNCYSEGGIEYGAIPRGICFVAGGNIVGGRCYSEGPDAASVRVAHGLSATPGGWTGGDDVNQWGSSLGSTRAGTALYQCGHTDDPDVSTPGINGFKISYSSARDSYEFLKGLSTRLLAITTTNWSKGNYNGIGLFAEQGIIVGDGGSSAVRLKAANATLGGNVTKGSVHFDANPSPGGRIAQRVTTSGVVGSGAVVENIFGSPVKISVSATEPASPAENDIWIDIS